MDHNWLSKKIFVGLLKTHDKIKDSYEMGRGVSEGRERDGNHATDDVQQKKKANSQGKIPWKKAIKQAETNNIRRAVKDEK